MVASMNKKLKDPFYEACHQGCVRDNKGILEQRIDYQLNAALKLSSRFRHNQLVKDIIELHYEMVAIVNKKLETPLHKACCQGKADVIILGDNRIGFEGSPISCSAIQWKRLLRIALCRSDARNDAESKQFKKVLRAAAGSIWAIVRTALRLPTLQAARNCAYIKLKCVSKI
ncbi:hypothetical protein Patl1_34068 [Pistacia atlantica]|uniref:Uncharacterized protein n=1 Tax=Pistacia atlantica TaxID=434234 RepID=A0ACC0ZS25_9ROSI|nr:hypothetical protein Patl1_34068 [Pistacia atlantica]